MLQELKEAVVARDENAILNLIQEHPSVLEATDENGSSGFMLITYGGFPEAFQKAVELKSSFTFHEAIVSGKMELVAQYLQQPEGDLVNEYSPDGFAPVSLAAFFNQTEIAKFLLKNGANPNLAATNPSKVNALHSAVARENIELCKILLEHGVDVNAPQMQNVTALHSAVHRGNLELTRLLIKNGATIDATMDNGDTPLSIAKNEGHSAIEEYLLSMK